MKTNLEDCRVAMERTHTTLHIALPSYGTTDYRKMTWRVVELLGEKHHKKTEGTKDRHIKTILKF